MNPDFSKYDASQLRQILGTIDAARFPQRVEEIHARLAQLEQAAATAAPTDSGIQDRSADLPIVQRVGIVLMVIGAIDIAVMIYYLATVGSYSSQLNILALIAGFFVWRGGMRASAIVRWIVWATLPGVAFMAIAAFGFMPLDLTLTQMRLYPREFFTSIGLMIGYAALLLWVARELGSAPVLAARVAAGRTLRDMRIPLALGVAGALIGLGVMAQLLGGDRAHRAEAAVATKLGATYRFHTQSMQVMAGSGKTTVSASVAAWKKDELLNVPVQWSE
jgi:hypothetical protein